jgi:peptidoglycan/LPS O-acetylase OafA/YrhL
MHPNALAEPSPDAAGAPVRAAAHAAQRIDAVQLLRALAAAMVVFGHLKGAAWAHQDELGPFPRLAFFGGAGVDLFFAISGFIIVHAGLRLLDERHPGRTFLIRRLARIVPLYWGVTMLPLAAAALLGRDLPPVAAFVMSLLFIPHDRSGTGEYYPLCDLGWTLNYEIEFYVLFAFWMIIGKARCVGLAIASLCLIVVAGALLAPPGGVLYFWSRPILLEFAGGMGIALLYNAGRLQFSGSLRIALVTVALALYIADPLGLIRLSRTPNEMVRVVGWGIPGLLLLLAALSSPFMPRSRLARGGVLLGNASFALYLLHPFAITASRRLIAGLPLPYGTGGWVLVGVGFVLACTGSIVAYVYLEKPLTAWLAAALTGKSPAPRKQRQDFSPA